MLEITNLKATIENNTILNGIDFKAEAGNVYAIMGPNGSGKSTLSKIIAGNPNFKIQQGEIKFKGESILGLSPEERALRGIFLGFQYPIEINGVSNTYFMRLAYNAKQKFLKQPELDAFDFEDLIIKKLSELGFKKEFLSRDVNSGFSGGEKKQNEILQMAILEPELAILDEIDSGLDIDALKKVSDGINKLRSDKRTIILITHYKRLLEYIEPDQVAVIFDGKIVHQGDKNLVQELEEKGYDWLTKSK